MDKETVLRILADFRRVLESKGIKINKLVLFGSYAKNSYREGSDIDVVVISHGFVGKKYWERIEILSDAIYEVFEPIEAIAMTPQEWKNKDSLIVDYARRGEAVLV